MSRDTSVIAFRQPDDIDDPLTELAREGARRMLAQVLIAEADAFVAWWKDFEVSGWSRPHRAARPWAGTHDPDRGRACRGPSRQGARPLSAAIRVCLGGRGLLQARMEDNAECILVLIGATPEVKKGTCRLPAGSWT